MMWYYFQFIHLDRYRVSSFFIRIM